MSSRYMAVSLQIHVNDIEDIPLGLFYGNVCLSTECIPVVAKDFLLFHIY